ncbi:MAG: HesA/MoeB/ThiF family protein [Gammaproteobacteria bacterium]|nr:HesA/MoeB/ThiF family protein [Gammaproteobacteria bacterium]
MNKLAEKPGLSDDELLRYSRQIMLPQIEIAGQLLLLRSHVILFGAGGLGSPIAMYLAASGVGKITLVDPDEVDLSNLQRQIIHRTESIGHAKAISAKKTLAELNPLISVRVINSVLTEMELEKEIRNADVVVDATDNFEARFAINAACVKEKTPLVVGAVIRFEGQVMVFTMQDDSACYQCLYPNQEELEESCSQTGVLGSVAGLVGCLQATEVIKLLVNIGEILSNKLMLIDALNLEWHTLKINQDPKCAVCAK